MAVGLAINIAYETGRLASFRTHAGSCGGHLMMNFAYETGRLASFRTLAVPTQTTARIGILNSPFHCRFYSQSIQSLPPLSWGRAECDSIRHCGCRTEHVKDQNSQNRPPDILAMLMPISRFACCSVSLNRMVNHPNWKIDAEQG